MTEENQQTAVEKNSSEGPQERELFAGNVREELSEHEVFVGNEDFYKLLTDSVQPITTKQPVAASQLPPLPIRRKRFSNLQKILAVSIVLVWAMLLYTLLKRSSQPVPAVVSTPATQQQTPSPEPSAENAAYQLTASEQQTQESKPAPAPTEALSLNVAQNFYLQKDYDKAYAVYEKLRQSLPAGPEEGLMRDFLQLRMALCMKKAADSEQAGRLFKAVLRSRSPVVRAIANYHCSLLEMQKNQYLKARTRAYQAIALVGAVDFDRNWALLLHRDCHLLVAESMTRNVLSLCDADEYLPEQLLNKPVDIDPFTNLSEAQLRSFLNSGSEQLSKGLLGPQIQKLEHTGSSPRRWSVICHGASIEELLARFAANVGLDIHWACSRTPTSEEIRNTVCKRPVSLYLPATTTQQFVATAAGCVGLLARLDKSGVVNIFNPAQYSSLSEHVSLLSREAISLWQRFLLTFHGNERSPNAHFALALLQAQSGRVTESIAEYKLVANRFSQTSLAPFALLHSSRLKTNLRDYFGAREDLMQLTELYPDADIADQACLYLADATMKAGLKTEAGRLYRKVYNLDFSLESQTTAALGAAKSFYEIKDYETAAKWLTRYISLVRDRTSKNLYSAYFLLGKTNLALGKHEAACDAFQSALAGPAGQLSREEYVEIVSTLIEAYMEQEHFVEALDILENIHSWQFSQKEFTEILLLKAKVLRSMGLVDKAVAVLGDRAQYIPDPQLKAKVSFELTNCYITKGNFELARSSLTEILVLVEPGPLAHEIALKLADVCLKLGQNAQTISICSQLLDLAPAVQIKQKALDLLASAYSQQKNYDRAALALLDQWNGSETTNTKEKFGNSTVKGETLLGQAR